MPVRIYAHLSWTTWGRLPLIDKTVADFLLRFLLGEAKRHGARVIEIGVVPDHVHILLELPPVGHSRNKSLRGEAGYDLRTMFACKSSNTGARALEGSRRRRAGASAHGFHLNNGL